MNYEYRFHFKFNEKQITVHMESYQNDNKHLDATLSLNASGRAYPHFSDTHHDLCGDRRYLWQALKLWLKRVPFHTHPKKSDP